jgi:hypothetical protein
VEKQISKRLAVSHDLCYNPTMAYFLLFYFVFLIGFAIFSVAGMYHLWRFGYVGDLTKPALIIYIVLSSIVIIVSIILILTYSWSFNFSPVG